MGTDFTERLRRALALRHTPEARGFFTAVLEVLCPDDPRGAEHLGEVLADPVGLRSATLDAWLRIVAGAMGADPERALAHRDQLVSALAAVSCRPAGAGPSVRNRARDALRVAAQLG